MTIEFVVPVKTGNGLNMREHWRARSSRVKKERTTAALMTPSGIELPCTVRMDRLSSSKLDDDNLHGACKAIRDGIADKIGFPDNDPRIVWLYGQEKCKRGDFGVRVLITEG